MLTGGCRCGAVRYRANVTDVTRHAVCHCNDCRRSSGAPAMAWFAVPKDRFSVTSGNATRWDGTGGAERYFCGQCGTGLYYFNEAVLPGICDIQSSTLDDAAAYAPVVQIQCAERLPWMADLHAVHGVERFPVG